MKEHFVERNACFDDDAPNSKQFVDVYISCHVIIHYKRIQNMFYEHRCCFHTAVV